eukprot:TRINITY_DN4843_c0_g3_i1.p1 TRINITY_DN4843_c0_g3~~TRINITY_DN4843_c0_g3_i1.p1  ORF type:complete len:290 (-),score=3.65 TRINITY_DN4843_c0_g3_i1:382-1140(-)
MALLHDPKGAGSYSSAPPWVLHRYDAEYVFPAWVKNAVLMHEAWPDMLAEQGSYGITQAKHGIKSSIDSFWFLSSVNSAIQPWSYVQEAPYDPCKSRHPPAANLNIPPLWHACAYYEIPHLLEQGFSLHKDRIHKDLLDCNAPLLHYPPQDALEHYYVMSTGKIESEDTISFQETWAVCTYTNLVNYHAATYKGKFCNNPNLDPSFSYPKHSEGFILADGIIQRVFRRGGWKDVDYIIGRKNETVANSSASA